jgi:hypothetical protein
LLLAQKYLIKVLSSEKVGNRQKVVYMNTKKVFAQSLVNSVVEGLGAMGINAECTNKDLLDCAIDVIRKIKEGAKEALKAQDAADKKVKDAEAFENGKNLLKDAKVGDIATVICGSGKFAKEYDFPIVKIGEKTITVEYTEENTPNGTTGPRYPSLAKVVAVRKAE